MPLVPQRARNGINTGSRPGDLFGDYQWPAPIDQYEYRTDFSTYAAGDWTVATTNSSTSALTAGNGGLLIQTTGATSTNYHSNYLASTSFAFTPGYRTWFWINVKLSDVATHCLWQAGLVDTLSTNAVPTHGVYFSKPDASAAVTLVLNKNTTKTTIAVGTMVIATAHTLGYYYDGKQTPTLYIYSSIGMTANTAFGLDPVYGGRPVVAAGVNAVSGNLLTNLPLTTTGLTVGFGLTAGESVAKTATYDYVGAAMQVARF
jgi:hypothetical protein